MARTFKALRPWVKQEKRIVKLMYRKGLIDVDINDLYWEAYRRYGGKYNHSSNVIYYPEIHFAVVDYWNEVDEIPLVSSFVEQRIWEGVPDDKLSKLCQLSEEKNLMSATTFKCKSRRWLMKWLKSQPNVRCDNKINKILKIGYV